VGQRGGRAARGHWPAALGSTVLCNPGPGGGALVIFTGLCAGGTGVNAMDVAATGMAIVPTFELLE
jgi:hypothetical protein